MLQLQRGCEWMTLILQQRKMLTWLQLMRPRGILKEWSPGPPRRPETTCPPHGLPRRWSQGPPRRPETTCPPHGLPRRWS